MSSRTDNGADLAPLVAISVGFLPEAQSLFSRFTNQPSGATKIAINRCIGRLISTGVWPKLDVVRAYAAQDQQSALLNWVSTSYTATAADAPTFTPFIGYTGNGTSSYLDEGFNPITAVSPKYVQNSGHISFWDLTARAADTTSQMGMRVSTTTQSVINTRFTGNSAYARINTAGGAVNSGVLTNTGHYIANRTDSVTLNLKKNGATIASSGAIASVAPPNANVFSLARNFGGVAETWSSDTVGFITIGGGLTDSDAANLYSAIYGYMTDVGAVVGAP